MTTSLNHTYNVCVFIGDEAYHVEVQDHDTCGLLLSECIRSFMDKHDDQDPGLLGLKILEDGRDLDLGADVIDSIKVGETVLGVSYTVHRTEHMKVDKKSKETLRGARKFGSPKPPSPKSKRRSGSLTWMLRKVGLASRDDAEDGDEDSSLGLSQRVVESETSTTLGGTRAPSPSKDTATASQNSMFGRSLAFLSRIHMNEKNQSKERQRSLLGKEIHHIFTPLTHVSKDVEKREKEQRRLVRQGRTGVGELAALDVKRFLCSVVKDPSQDLPAAVTLVVGNSRMTFADDDDGVDHYFDWKLDVVHSWGDTGKFMFVNVIVPKSTKNAIKMEDEEDTFVWRFELEIGEKNVLTRDVLDALSTRCSQIGTMRKRAARHQESLNNLLPRDHADHHLKSFLVTRHEDPSGLLPKRCLVYVGTQRVVVADSVTKDTLCNWPFTMIFSWKVDFGEITFKVLEDSKKFDYSFKTKKSWYIKYELEKSINIILKHNSETELQVGRDIPKTELRAIEETYRREEEIEKKRREELLDKKKSEKKKKKSENDDNEVDLLDLDWC